MSGIHAKCHWVRIEAGRTLICHKSADHTASTDPGRRGHYDSGADVRWSDDPAAGVLPVLPTT